MAEIRRSNLFAKLNSLGYKATEGATVFCKMRGNPYVELVHLLHQILQTPDSDFRRIIAKFGLDQGRLAADLLSALDKLPRGATSISDFSPHLEEAVERGWVYASLLFNDSQVRTGYLVFGILKTPGLRRVFTDISPEFSKIKADELSDNFAKVVEGSVEETLVKPAGTVGGGVAPGEASGAMAPAAMGKQEALARFSTDLTDKARKGEIDPIVGRDEEIRQIIDILMRRRQNNPILTGEAGVGKTAVVEGFALRIASGDVPPALKDVTLRTLDLGLLQAGASMKGEFENRLKQVIEEVQSSPKPVILFIDEAHTLIGAGGSAGQGDAANLLKPALARGTLRTIAATTWAEYKKYFEKDPALTRRFQVIKVEEPSEAKAVLMIRGLSPVLEKHHQVDVLDEALVAAAQLSHRYIPSRQLPDKAVSLIDTACARVAISQHATPPEVEDCQRRLTALEVELEILGRESAVGKDHEARQTAIMAKLDEEKANLERLDTHWQQEKGAVKKILDLRAKLRASAKGTGEKPAPATAADQEKRATEAEAQANLLSTLKELEKELTTLQGETPLVFPSVDEQAVAAVLADWTGIPVGRMVKNEIEAVLGLADTLEKRVIGQRHALDSIARRIQTSRAQLDNPNRPIGVFMLVGPSGTGKTETALTLAEALYGGEQNMISINMSEFQESHTVSTLKGAPPGYVGYGEGGVLTEAVRRRPYSVVLLDEVEKAHRDVHEIFFQVFDKGWMEDGEGRYIDFKNTIIILTSNAAQDMVVNMCKDPELLPDPEGLEKAMRGPLTKVFPDALLNRLVVVPYYPISKEVLERIIKLNLARVGKRVLENHQVAFTYDDNVPELIGQRCSELERGARMVDALITNTMLPEIGREILSRLATGREIKRVHVTAQEGNFSYLFD